MNSQYPFRFFSIYLSFSFLLLFGCKPSNAKVIIHLATYGSIVNPEKTKNVLEIVEKNLIYTDKGEVLLDMTKFSGFSQIFGDPAPGEAKQFKISYYYIYRNSSISLNINESDLHCNRVILLK